MDRGNWWDRRWFLALLVFGSAVPLLWPETPPLVDLPGHMGRFRVQIDLHNSAELQRYFDFQWVLVGNLGVDLLVSLLAPVIGIEAATKLIIVAIPPLTATGLILVAREIHGRVPPTVMFTIPFIYSFPFNFGFLNYSLALALALLAFALWLRLSAGGSFLLRAVLFVPISVILWVAHAFGWGILGLLTFSSELIRHHDRTHDWKRASFRAAVDVLPMGLPLLLMVFGHSGTVAGVTDRFFDILPKLFSLVAILRDRWLLWDSFGVGVAVLLLGAVAFDNHLERSRKLMIPAVVLGTVFVVMPGRILGLSYADMRLAPLMIMIALLAIRVRPDLRHVERRLAWLGLIFVCFRLIGNTASFGIADRQMRTLLTALDRVPAGAPVLTLVGDYCNERWAMPRNSHVGSFVILRKYGFSNDQWQAAGAQLLRVRYAEAGHFDDDRSAIIYPSSCIVKTEKRMGQRIVENYRTATALEKFPRDAFDYVWLVDPPDFDMRARPGLTPIWRREDAVLYQVEHAPK